MLTRLRVPRRLAASLLVLAPAAAPAQLLGPSPYLSRADSPFSSMAGFSYFHFEDFEDKLLNVPGVATSPSAFVVRPSNPNGDSVDGDDGTIDGFGRSRHSFALEVGSVDHMRFVFDAAALGGLPTHVGIVWTDGVDPVLFEAFDRHGVSLGTRGGMHADARIDGTTGEDRFYGAIHAGGISRIRFAQTPGTFIEVDHLQYGLLVPSAVPEPSTVALVAGGLAALAALARRRRAPSTDRETGS